MQAYGINNNFFRKINNDFQTDTGLYIDWNGDGFKIDLLRMIIQ